MGWLLFVLQSLNPIGGLTASIPLGIRVLGLSPLLVALLAGPITFITTIAVHVLWEWLRSFPRVARWLDGRRSIHVEQLLERRGSAIAAALGALVFGGTPTYVTLRFVGLTFGRFWAPLLFGQVVKGYLIAYFFTATRPA